MYGLMVDPITRLARHFSVFVFGQGLNKKQKQKKLFLL